MSVRSVCSCVVLVLGALVTVGPVEAQENQDAAEYDKATAGTRILEGRNGFQIKMLVEASNLGGDEVEIGEITFPVGSGQRGGQHQHGRVEIFYVLSGQLDHVVNDESHILDPGMVGIVRPGDVVVHRVVGDEPATALVIWAPGGEAARIAPNLTERPVGGR